MNWSSLDISIEALQKHYRQQDFTPRELLAQLNIQCEQYAQKNIWIHTLSTEELEPYFVRLEQSDPTTLPLYGVPFAIKDNIDLANIPTTAACEAFRYLPDEHAFVVACLINAGAIPVGKTNMDQFATGLVGTRSPEPWGPCHNAFDDSYISGGSSSGSAVAVSLGLASFSLGTDTAGSGRVPAAFNNLVGLKPTRGLLSTRGVVPACRTLDVVSVFATNADDANSVLNVAAQFDQEDTYARANPYANSSRCSGISSGPITLGVPQKNQLEFFGDSQSEQDFYASLDTWRKLGASIVEIDFSPFMSAARALYEGPWVAERYIATAQTLKTAADAMDPTVRKIVSAGNQSSAVDTFSHLYAMQGYKKQSDLIMAEVDALITPTAGRTFTIEDIQQKPIEYNSQLGYYTNYMNLLDYAAIAMPNIKMTTPVPNGFTLVTDKFCDQQLLALCRRWLANLPQALGCNLPASQPPQSTNNFLSLNTIDVAVCGAHLQGQPLNWQLTERGATLKQVTKSAANYALYALADGKRPAMVRDSNKGAAIEVEVWIMPAENFGSFVAGIPQPLGIGKVELANGESVSGFICEENGIEGATDISELGSWRRYLELK